MADATGNVEAKAYATDVPVTTEGYFLKGNAHADWGVKDRLSRIFNPKSGNTVMLAFDHGYCMGPTSGLERLDLAIPPLADYADCLMCSRGALRSSISPTVRKPIALRASAGDSILSDTMFESEVLGVSIEDAVRCNASALAVQVCVGSENESQTIENLIQLVDLGTQYSIPILGVTAVGRQLTRDARYLGLATRIIAEIGANFVKSYFCEEGFEKVVAGCPVPIVIAGGKKVPEAEALEFAYRAIDQGAAGVDMGRNVFQSENPAAMIQAVGKVVHEGAKPSEAYDFYLTLKNA